MNASTKPTAAAALVEPAAAAGQSEAPAAARHLEEIVEDISRDSFPASDRLNQHGTVSSMQSTHQPPKIYVTTHDYERLSALAEFYKLRRRGAVADFLANELDRAELVAPSEISPGVVTMHSSVRIKDPDTGEFRTVSLVYPGEEDSLRGKVSIGTHLGAALLGLPEGGRMDWLTMDGRRKSVEVVEVQYQPEAHGLDRENTASGSSEPAHAAASSASVDSPA